MLEMGEGESYLKAESERRWEFDRWEELTATLAFLSFNPSTLNNVRLKLLHMSYIYFFKYYGFD